MEGYANDLAAELASTLDWWSDAGVDALVQDEARAWLVEPPSTLPGTGRWLGEAETEGSHDQAESTADGGPPPPRPAGAVPHGRVDHAPHGQGSSGGRPDPTIVPGRIEEPFPTQLDLFQEWLRTSATLPYAAPAAPRICPSGDPASGLMIFAAMPSSEDCSAGTLLSGAPGRLFDRMLAAMGRGRETIYLTGLSCFRPAGGRFDRSGGERCVAIARHHIALAAPKAVLLLGDACSKALLGIGAVQARGKVHKIEADGQVFDAIVTLSPEYLLSQPAAKAMAWADLQLLMENLAAKD